MFLRNANWLRYSAVVLLVLVVNLAGLWPLMSQSATRGVDIFQRYGAIMSAKEALDFTLQAEFCGEAPSAEKQPVDWDAHPNQPDGKLILLGEAPSLPAPTSVLIGLPMEDTRAGRLTGLPETPPPRA